MLFHSPSICSCSSTSALAPLFIWSSTTLHTIHYPMTWSSTLVGGRHPACRNPRHASHLTLPTSFSHFSSVLHDCFNNALDEHIVSVIVLVIFFSTLRISAQNHSLPPLMHAALVQRSSFPSVLSSALQPAAFFSRAALRGRVAILMHSVTR